jgi:hypothetical protein
MPNEPSDAAIRRNSRIPVKELPMLNTWIDGVRVDTVRLSRSASRIDPLWVTFETASGAVDIELSFREAMDLAEALDELAQTPIPDEPTTSRPARPAVVQSAV